MTTTIIYCAKSLLIDDIYWKSVSTTVPPGTRTAVWTGDGVFACEKPTASQCYGRPRTTDLFKHITKEDTLILHTSIELDQMKGFPPLRVIFIGEINPRVIMKMAQPLHSVGCRVLLNDAEYLDAPKIKWEEKWPIDFQNAPDDFVWSVYVHGKPNNNYFSRLEMRSPPEWIQQAHVQSFVVPVVVPEVAGKMYFTAVPITTRQLSNDICLLDDKVFVSQIKRFVTAERPAFVAGFFHLTETSYDSIVNVFNHWANGTFLFAAIEAIIDKPSVETQKALQIYPYVAWKERYQERAFAYVCDAYKLEPENVKKMAREISYLVPETYCKKYKNIFVHESLRDDLENVPKVRQFIDNFGKEAFRVMSASTLNTNTQFPVLNKPDCSMEIPILCEATFRPWTVDPRDGVRWLIRFHMAYQCSTSGVFNLYKLYIDAARHYKKFPTTDEFVLYIIKKTKCLVVPKTFEVRVKKCMAQYEAVTNGVPFYLVRDVWMMGENKLKRVMMENGWAK